MTASRRRTMHRLAIAAGLLAAAALILGACEPIVQTAAPGASIAPGGSLAPGTTPAPAITPGPKTAPSATPLPTPLIVSPAPLKADPVSLLAFIFNPIFQAFLILMVGVKVVVGDMGLAIIITTLIVRTALVPLMRRQMVSMRRMQAIAPEVKEVQRRYKNDRAKQQQATMALYKERGVSQAGCLTALLPLLLILPMYQVVREGLTAADLVESLKVFGFQVVPLTCPPPHLIILPAAAVAGTIAWKLHQAARARAAALETEAAQPIAIPSSIGWDEVSDDAALGLELGFALVGLVDERKGAPLMTRITGIRRQLSRELGFVVPMVRVRDELTLSPNSYRITVAGVVAAEDEIWPDDLLALDSGDLIERVDGRQVKDPTFGLDAVWIAASRRAEAVVAGYTVVDPATVVATHLNQVIQTAAADLFGMDEAQKLIDALKENAPQLAANITPQPLSLPAFAALCRALLAEGVPLKDFRRIGEAMADAARDETDPVQLVEAVRQRIGALIIQTLVPVRMPLPVVTLDPGLENLLSQAVRAGRDAVHPIEPGLSQRIVQAVGEVSGQLMSEGRRFAIVTSPIARRALSRLLALHVPDAPVLSLLEIPDNKPVEVVAIVGGEMERPLLESEVVA